MIERVYVDLDGVLADFFGGACQLFDQYPSQNTEYEGLASSFGMSGDAFWAAIDAAGAKFWASLDAYSWAPRLMQHARRIAGEDVYIATSPSWHGSSAHGKIEWMDRHFAADGHFRKYVIGPNKQLLANERAMLIDDSLTHIRVWCEAGGRGLLWPQPYNISGDLEVARRRFFMQLANYPERGE